ncbi:hypothetical protein MG293_020794 [Ovis ammon polii]|uniref:Uncharacterized protein n=1 Tax=Ovis ammon polii TaxID=230172 RepID=A0AAD4XX06_OVIAM|nr:hypothetical protein MG293_020794 [Ovis ammon polii]
MGGEPGSETVTAHSDSRVGSVVFSVISSVAEVSLLANRFQHGVISQKLHSVLGKRSGSLLTQAGKLSEKQCGPGVTSAEPQTPSLGLCVPALPFVASNPYIRQRTQPQYADSQSGSNRETQLPGKCQKRPV